MTAKAPYIDKELEDLHARIKRGLHLLEGMKKDDPNFPIYLDKFFALIHYFVENTTPIEGMRVLVDDRSDKLPQH